MSIQSCNPKGPLPRLRCLSCAFAIAIGIVAASSVQAAHHEGKMVTGSPPPGELAEVTMMSLTPKGTGSPIGTVRLYDSEHGLVLEPDLKGLQPGLHGFHVHTRPNCGEVDQDGPSKPGAAAGGHYDPEETGKHGAPWGTGHKGDLPALAVGKDGRATLPVLAPRLDLEAVRNRALMIHEGGDTYSDHPEKLGGGGARVACGIVQEAKPY